MWGTLRIGAVLAAVVGVSAGPNVATVGGAAPPDEPITHVSQHVLNPEDGWLSADGRYALIRNGWDYQPKVVDRATGQVVASLPRGDHAVLVPDGSAVIVQSSRDLAGNGAIGAPQLFRFSIGGAGTPERLEVPIDPDLAINLQDTSHDGRVLALTVNRFGESYPDIRPHVLVARADGSVVRPDVALGGDRLSDSPTVSADGKLVTFRSWVAGCVPTECAFRTAVVDLDTQSTLAVDVAADGGAPNGRSSSPTMSADGTAVVFFSDATNLIDGTVSSAQRLYLRDLVAGTTELIADSPGHGFASVSADGNRVVYMDHAPTCCDPTYDGWQVHLRDRVTDTTHVMSGAPGGRAPTGMAQWGRISDDGRTVIFSSEATNLIDGVDGREIYARGPLIARPPSSDTPRSIDTPATAYRPATRLALHPLGN